MEKGIGNSGSVKESVNDFICELAAMETVFELLVHPEQFRVDV